LPLEPGPRSAPSGAAPALERLNARDVRVLLLWALAAIAGASVAYRYFFRAFPEASVNFKVPRAAALAEAQEFATAQGAALSGYQSAIVFDVNDEEKTYLEREVGLDQANRLMSSSDVNVWYWETRFFQPLRKEEFHVRVDPAGRIVGYGHVLDEAAPGARLTRDAAQNRAEVFLRDVLQTPLDTYTSLPEEANSTVRPNRTDWSFTWERKDFRAKDAPYRLTVSVLGDRIGGYEEYLKVPEAWERSYTQLRSANDFIETLAIVPYAVLLGAALSMVLSLGRRGLLQWSGGLKLGLFITVLYFAMQMNSWPMTRAAYDTNGSYASFIAAQIAGALGMSALMALLVVVAVVPGEPLYRAGQPQRLRLGVAFTPAGMRTKEFFCSGVVGICLAGVHIGYVVLFYVIGGHFGVWAPQDLQYSDTLSTALPWIVPLTIGIYAAASEEFLFRLFSIRFLLRLTDWRILAVILPAFAWGFLHANYPVEPPYIRGVEVGLIGILTGLVMLRWGIVATLIWHYSVDAFLVGLSLMRSPDLYSRISGTLVGLGGVIVVGAAGVMYVARGGFADQTALLNGAEPLVETPLVAAERPATAAPAMRYTALAPSALAVLCVCGAIGLALALGVRPKDIGTFVRFGLDARDAQARADAFLRGRNIDPKTYRSVATIQYTMDPLVNEYLRRSIGVDAANHVYETQVPSAFWTVRYFRALQPEEFLVVQRTDGALHSLHHTLAEATPGANLSKDDALAIASAFLRDQKGLDPSQWNVAEAVSNKLPARTDHTFTWEELQALDKPPMAGDGAHVRVEVKVQGDEVSSFRTFIHVPEEWERLQDRTTLAATIKNTAFGALVTASIVIVLIIFFRHLGQPELAAVPWRRIAKSSLVVLAASVITSIMMAPQYLANYRTDLPFAIYLGTLAIVLPLAATLAYSVVFLGFGLAWLFLARTYGAEQLPSWGRKPPLYYRDALFIGLGGAAALAGLTRLPALLAEIWPVPLHALPANVPERLDMVWPALHALAAATTRSLIFTALLAIALGFVGLYLRQVWTQVALLALLAALLAPQWGSGGEFLQSIATDFVTFSVIWWGARRIVRLNLLGYVLIAMLLALASAADELLRQPNPFFRANGWGVVAAAALLLLWPAILWKTGGTPVTVVAAPAVEGENR
jgi:membrane protease YdiL (CAAX protease family)